LIAQQALPQEPLDGVLVLGELALDGKIRAVRGVLPALIAEGRTIAVLAAGIDVAYPAGNARLFAEISENGALVSEVLPGAHAIPSRFLTRNRIIAALSQATLVVEAAFRSGSLRTARDAAELMRPVMAIPGPINAPTSEGCHRLIGERAAEIVTSVSDAIELVSAL
jgi:DNA protecting protein DprA